MQKSITKFVLSLGVFAAIFLGVVHADSASATNLHLKVTPVSFDYELNPGDVVSGSFKVSNKNSELIHYQAQAVPYYATEKAEGGFDVSYDKESTHTQIVDWVTFDNPTGEIEPNSSVEINFTITVPDSVTAGGQYTALLVSNANTNSENFSDGVSIAEVANIGPVVYAKVNGDGIATTGEILSHTMDGFRFSPPISFSATVKNTGNVHTDATYIMKVYPLFSGESIYNNEEHPGVATVLPDSTRYYTLSWDANDGAPSVGIYKVRSEVKIFDETSVVEQTVIICPVWVLILIIIFIIAAVIWIVSRIRQRRQS